PVLLGQIEPLLATIELRGPEITGLRAQLLQLHQEQSAAADEDRTSLLAEHDRVVKEIGEVFSQRKEAEALGVLDTIDSRLAALRCRRDDLRRRLDGGGQQSDEWVEAVIRTFELFELLREAFFFGSWRLRQMFLKCIASNYVVRGGKLLPELRPPFRHR